MTTRNLERSQSPLAHESATQGPVGLTLNHDVEGEQLSVGDRVYLSRPFGAYDVVDVDVDIVVSYGVLVDFDSRHNPIILWDGEKGVETYHLGEPQGRTSVRRAARGTIIGSPVTWTGVSGESHTGHVVAVRPHWLIIEASPGKRFTVPHSADPKFP